MNTNIFFVFSLFLFISCNTKNSNVDNRLESDSEVLAQQTNADNYDLAMKAYEQGNYKKASLLFQTIMDNSKIDDISSNRLFNGACIFALAEEKKMAIEVLKHLASKRYYSSYDDLLSDTDLNNIHSESEWQEILNKVAENKKTEPERLRQNIKTELLKAKDILYVDKGKLWGENIWSNDILVLDFDNTIYALEPSANSKTTDSIIYYKKIPERTLGFSNAAQRYNGKEYAVILSNYLDDNSATIIHELFHVIQNQHIILNGNPIEYLDNYDAREWLRLEYQALRTALNAIDQKKEISETEKYVSDAMLFRKLRQSKYKDYLQKEIEIETSEGLANYTGYILSTYPNKFKKAIAEIDYREQAQTYTRPFPYATGLAYGLIFDYLKVDWKVGLDTTYNFLNIYETKYLKKEINISTKNIKLAQKRNNYQEIHEQEIDRKTQNEKKTSQTFSSKKDKSHSVS